MTRHWALAAMIVLAMAAAARAQGNRPPPQEELDKAEKDIAGSDKAAQDAAVQKVMAWIKGGWVSDHLWRNWLPALVKDGRQQDVADLALEGVLRRPDPVAIVPLMQFRYQALLALNKNDEALPAAKTYFDVAEMKNTARGVDAVAVALARVHPDDPAIARKWRSEQTDAAAGKAVAESVLQGIKIDDKVFQSSLNMGKTKTAFRDRLGYGDLLLAADKPEEAEKVFREVYQTAETQDQVNQSLEAIAKSLRDQDGNPTRADAWLVEAQKQAASTPVATRPATTRAATKPRDPNLP